MNKCTECYVSYYDNLIHKAALHNDYKAFQKAAKMRNFNTCNILRIAIVADQLKKYRGY